MAGIGIYLFKEVDGRNKNANNEHCRQCFRHSKNQLNNHKNCLKFCLKAHKRYVKVSFLDITKKETHFLKTK